MGDTEHVHVMSLLLPPTLNYKSLGLYTCMIDDGTKHSQSLIISLSHDKGIVHVHVHVCERSCVCVCVCVYCTLHTVVHTT